MSDDGKLAALPAVRDAKVLVDSTLLSMRMLVEFPAHCQSELFRREIDRAMALGGWDSLKAVDRSLLSRPPRPLFSL